MNITEFRRGDRRADPATIVDPSGKLVLGENEIPVAPADAEHAGGIRVVVLEGGY